MVRGSPHIACVFDFDDTLVPDSTTSLLESRGVDPKDFWGTSRKLVVAGYDPTLAWLRLFLDAIGDGQPLGRLSNVDLRAHGATLDDALFPGLDTLLDDLRAQVQRIRDVTIEFYIVSGGLREVVIGSEFVRNNFAAVYACELDEDKDGVLHYIRRCVSFTEKTRYLFEINKGIDAKESVTNPYVVNKAVEDADRRVPFSNMIYVGDGLTDIPCFSVVGKAHGYAFGVFDPSQEGRAKRALTEFLEPGRVTSMHRPRYGPDDELGSILRAAVATIATRIGVSQNEALGPR